jgi:antibiotic biosynthesis monooxygenase (ABM) superfamily enzyme
MSTVTKADEEPMTVVVRRRVRPGREAEFEAAMRDFIGFALASPGHLDIHVLRPTGAGPADYTVVDKFATAEARRAFKESSAYQLWMQRLKALTEGDPQIEEMGGLAGWFTLPERPNAKPPAKYKMAFVTFLGVYPLATALPPFFGGLLPGWHLLLLSVVVNVAVVGLLTWVVMPLLTTLFASWLFAKTD